MTHERQLQSITDNELLRRLANILDQSRRRESELVAHLGEVDRRRLFAREGCSSMFVYCIERLHLSEHEAYLRIAAARAARQHPVLLVMLRDGRLHLSGIGKLAPHLTETNRQRVLARAAHKSKRQIEELIAELAPKPDVPASVRKLPDRTPMAKPAPPPSPSPGQLGPDRVTDLLTSRARPDVAPPSALQSMPMPSPPPPRSSAKVEPLSPTRYKIQFTASAELHEKLQRLRALTCGSACNGDLATIIEEAVTEKLQRLEAKRFAETKKPRKRLEDADTLPATRHIPAAVRRAVRQRDADRCTFRDAQGRRCTERHRLEFHHHDPYGLGGDHSVENISLRCRAHNMYEAERAYGVDVMEKYRTPPDRVRETAPAYGSRIGVRDSEQPVIGKVDGCGPQRGRAYAVA